ncbi:MAG: glycoside hydrolase family 127 protein, partial [Lachnospiraceae bacterium]|nr:glycoside hydrolase family 127 protein [Lachnospiraceae bacterium]
MIIRDFALNEVEVTDGYLKNAFQREQEYLLGLDADRLLAGFYETAGKEPKQEKYPDNWEMRDTAGHTLGHYMTALAQVYASTQEERFLDCLTYVTESLKECQLESGYLS